jgi:hypothetical protein
VCAQTDAVKAVEYSRVALTGEQAPGLPVGITFTDFNFGGLFFRTEISPAGHVAFSAEVAGPGISTANNLGIWRAGTSSTDLLVQLGQSLPALGAGFVLAPSSGLPPILRPESIDDNGELLLSVRVDGPGVVGDTDFVFFKTGSSGLTIVAREGQAIPELGANVFFDGILGGYEEVSPNGEYVAFYTQNNGAGVTTATQNAFLFGQVGQFDPPLVPGDAAPGLPGVTIANAGRAASASGSFNRNNEVLAGYRANGLGTPLTAFPTADVLYKFGPSGPVLVAKRTDTLANTGVPGATIDSIGDGRLTTDGTFIGEFKIDGPGVVVQDDRVIGYVRPGGTATALYRRGGQAPLLPAGVIIDPVSAQMSTASVADNYVVTTATLSGTGITTGNNGVNYLVDSDGNIQLIAQKGDQAPGAATSVIFANIFTTVTSAGRVLLDATLTGPGVDATNNRGLWLRDADGQIEPLLRLGDSFDVNPGGAPDLRTITGFVNAAQVENENLGPNDTAPLLLSFSDGSQGLFTLSLAAIMLAGDLNGDGFVGIADLNIVLGNWNQNVTPGDPLLGDPSGDGYVGIEDLNAVLGNWNAGTPPVESNNIPEPTSLTIALLSCLALSRRQTGC